FLRLTLALVVLFLLLGGRLRVSLLGVLRRGAGEPLEIGEGELARNYVRLEVRNLAADIDLDAAAHTAVADAPVELFNPPLVPVMRDPAGEVIGRCRRQRHGED